MKLREEIASRVRVLKEQKGIVPGLAVVLVGEDPASQVYVRSKEKACQEVGFASFAHRLSSAAKQEEVLSLIAQLNADPKVHGILVQLPLPNHIDSNTVLNSIDPRKDVDGFHPVNVGRMTSGMDGVLPCTPKGCVMLIKGVLPDLSGKTALVVGRSNIVGKPMALLLLRENCTVTIAHSKTHDLPSVCRQADILVAALGKPEFIRGDWVKPDAVVIDVGVNRIPDGEKTKLVGDVAFAEAAERASAITPVPGGVGPMTIACLLQNTLEAAALS